MRRVRSFAPLAVAGLLSLGAVPAAPQEQTVLARIDEPGPLERLGLPVRAHLAGEDGRPFALVLATRARLDASGAAYRVVDPDAGGKDFGLVAPHPGTRRTGDPRVVRLDPGDALEPGSPPAIALDRDLVLAPPAISPIVRQAARDEQVAEMVACVRADRLTGWESRLTGETPVTAGGLPVTLVTRNTRSGPQIDAATQFVHDELGSMGLSVRFHDWVYSFTSNRNVVGELPGGARASEIVLVTAHVDDMPAGGPAPGADDNASGVAGLLEAARVLKDFRFDRTVRFVALTGEEQGLFGSKSYAALVSASRETVVAVLNLAMIAWDRSGGPVMNLHTRLPGNPGHPADLSIAGLFESVVSWYGLSDVLAPRIVADGEPRSDHSPFWAEGIPGVLAIEDDLDDFDPAYHTPYDVLSRLNVPYFANVVRATVGVAAHLAGPAPREAPTFVVPVVLSAPGAGGSAFTSQLAVANHGASPATVTYRYTATAGGGSGSFTERLGAGVQRIVPDAIEHFRAAGLAIDPVGSRIGTLRVSFEGLASASDAGVLVQTTTPVPARPPGRGSAGLAYRGLPVAALPAGPLALPALRQDAADRSNVALVNAGLEPDGPVTLRVSFVDGRSGATSGTVEAVLEPGAFEQFRLTEIAPQAAGRDGWALVERLWGKAAWTAYGVVNDQANSDGSFVAPVDLAGDPAPAAASANREVILPVVVEAGGYETEVTVTNVSGAPRDLELTFTSPAILAPGTSASLKLRLEDREQKIIPSFVAALRESGAPGFAGANLLPFVGPLSASVPGGTAEGILVTGRTLEAASAATGASGRFGVAYAGVRSRETSDGPVWLLGLQQDDRSRSNLAVVNAGEPGSGDIEVRIELFDGEAGARAGELIRTVPARQVVQVDGILLLVPGAPRQGYARVTRSSGTGRFIAYAIVNDGAAPGEGSGDGAYVASDVGN